MAGRCPGPEWWVRGLWDNIDETGHFRQCARGATGHWPALVLGDFGLLGQR